MIDSAQLQDIPSRLVVTRTHQDDVRFRQVFVSLDGVSVGDLLYGHTLTREMPAGTHRVRIHNTLFWKTIEFTTVPGEEVRFQTVNYAGHGFWRYALIVGVAPLFLKVERVAG